MIIPIYLDLKTKFQKNWVAFQGQVSNNKGSLVLNSIISGASLVVQWLKVCLPTQGTWVQALVREDPTYHGATKPMYHSC